MGNALALPRARGETSAGRGTLRRSVRWQVLDIFRKKPRPRSVALQTGRDLRLIYHEAFEQVLSAYSEALGIAYQIRDDLSDLGQSGETDDIAGLRPSLLLAVAYEKAQGEKKILLEKIWSGTPEPARIPSRSKRFTKS